MAENLQSDEIAELPFSKNPYLRALQAANRIGLMGVKIEDIERTFPLGITDVLNVHHDIGSGEDTVPEVTIDNFNYIEGMNNG